MTEFAIAFQKLSKLTSDLSIALGNSFIEPLQTFHSECARQNEEILKKTESLIVQLEKKRKEAKHAREAYYQYSVNSEKCEERLKQVLERREASSNPTSIKDVQAQTDKKLEMKKFEQEARVEYEQKCRECNAAWTDFKNTFIPNFMNFDTREEIRIDQIKKKCVAACTELRAIQKKEAPFEVGDL